jgi:type IV pilus assembly protein PilW
MNGPFRSAGPRRHAARGATLIELMVALTIALTLSAAVFAVLKVAESRKRTMTGLNDIHQSGNFALFLIDKWVRSAGSGFTQAAGYAYGCPLYASRGGVGQLLPRVAALPAPFDQVVSTHGPTFRLAPLLILPGATSPSTSGKPSDVLIVMSASSGTTVLPLKFTDFASISGSAATLPLRTTQGLASSDLLLLADQDRPDGGTTPAGCMVEQLADTFSSAAGSAAPLGGSYFASQIGAQSLAALTDNAVAVNLGNVANGNPPQFLLIGVGDRNVLYTYDLLQTSDQPLQQRAEGVFELHALYGVDTNGDGKVSDGEWVSPTKEAYSPAALLAGTNAANLALQQIKAVRVGLILRTAVPERSGSAQAAPVPSVRLFSATTSPYTRTFAGSELDYRYRTLELTLPVRNSLLLD